MGRAMKEKDGGLERRGGGHGIRLTLLMVVCFLCEVGGWIALSKDGYKVTKKLLLNSGTRVEGDILVNGAILSSNYTWLGPEIDNTEACNPDRVGAMRWNELSKDFEVCSKDEKWEPMRFCDRHCGFSPAPLQSLQPLIADNGEHSLQSCPHPPNKAFPHHIPFAC